jgi:hypothetical protein
MYTHPTIHQQLALAQLADKHRHAQRAAGNTGPRPARQSSERQPGAPGQLHTPS